MKKLFWWVTRGRPMTLIIEKYFIDEVVNEPVNLYRDKFGRYWMANNRWGWFRVKANYPDTIK